MVVDVVVAFLRGVLESRLRDPAARLGACLPPYPLKKGERQSHIHTCAFTHAFMRSALTHAVRTLKERIWMQALTD